MPSRHRQELTRNKVWDNLSLWGSAKWGLTRSGVADSQKELIPPNLHGGICSVKDLCCKNTFQIHHFREEGSTAQQDNSILPTSAQGMGRSQQDLGDSSTSSFQLSCLEMGRTTMYKEVAADHRCQNSLPALYLMMVIFNSWQCPRHLPGTQRTWPEWCSGKQHWAGGEIHTHPCPQQHVCWPRELVWAWHWPTHSEEYYGHSKPTGEGTNPSRCSVSHCNAELVPRTERASLCVNLCQWVGYVR